MVLLLVFAFLAGIATVISPCVIPILPALLSASGAKGRYHPHGVVFGLLSAFTVFTLTIALIVQATGIPADFFRFAALAVIICFGCAMISPRLGAWFATITAPISAWGTSLQSQATGSGFFNGMLLGVALGLVWTPCAGPILATVTSLAITQQLSTAAVMLLLCYSLGASIPMFLIVYGGHQALLSSRYLSQHAETIRKIFGVLMIAAAFMIATSFDVTLQKLALKCFPIIPIEDTSLVIDRLALIGKNSNHYDESHQVEEGKLPKIGGTPEFDGIAQWFNSKPLLMSQLHGKVVLIDFWTYSCINCLRTLPYLKDWYSKYKDLGFVIVGVHAPEFEFEKDPGNVRKAVTRYGIEYPVALDNGLETWNAFGNLYWPAHYLVDQTGIIRQVHFGEGAYGETENAIRLLLGLPKLEVKEPNLPSHAITPETYLGYDRGTAYSLEITLADDKTSKYNYATPLQSNQVGLKGPWLVKNEYIEAQGDDSFLDLNFLSAKVFLVLGGTSEEPIRIFLNDRPLPKKYYTSDLTPSGELFVDMSRKYDILDTKGKLERSKLSLRIPKGVKAYAFTFGE